MLDKGTVFNNCLHRASTFTSSGLATLATGAWPAQHGIVADNWYEPGVPTPVQASEESLLATTLLGEIAGKFGGRTRITVVAGSRAQAGLFAGTPEARLFWPDSSGFATNGAAPEWLAGFSSPNLPAELHDANWLALGARADAPALRTLKWSAENPAEFLALYRSSPFAQAAVFDLASEAITRQRLGQEGSFDVLTIIPNATEQLGYETGAQSPLMDQLILQLDRRLEMLFNQLGRTPGEGNFNLALGVAHGAPAEPFAGARPRMTVNGEQLAQSIQTRLAAQGLPGVAKYIYPFLYLQSPNRRDGAGAEAAAEAVRNAAGRAAMADPAVAGYYTAGGACSVHDTWEDRFRNSFHPRRSGDVMLSYRPGYIEKFDGDRGVSYGSLYNYDARVPLAFYGPAFQPGIYEQNVESVDFAATLARVAGVAPPSSATGRVLGEALIE